MSPNLAWHETALHGSYRVLAGSDMALFEAIKAKPPYLKAYTMEVFRLQLPTTKAFITRIVLYSQLDVNHSNTHFTCCQETERIKWLDLNSLAMGGSFVEPFWGPELHEFTKTIKQGPFPQKVHEFSVDMVLKRLLRPPVPDSPEELLAGTIITLDNIRRLFVDFAEVRICVFLFDINFVD
jgi:hypothetical protein